MSESRQQPDALGVVDPIRLPAFAAAFGERVGRLPLYALAFLLLAVVSAVLAIARWAEGLANIDPFLSGLGLIFGSLPGSVVLLVPVAVAWSAERFGEVSPRIVRGSVAIGLSEVVFAASSFVGGAEQPAFLLSAVIGMFGTFLLAGGLIWLAHGLGAIRRAAPTSLGGRAGLVVVAVGVTLAVVNFAGGLVQVANLIPPLLGPSLDLDVDRDVFVADAVGLLSGLGVLGWTYLVWVLIRARPDGGRPERATSAGSMSGWLGLGWLGVSLLGTALSVALVAGAAGLNDDRTVAIGVVTVISVFASACRAMALVLLVWALATGLGNDRATGDVPVG